MNEKDIVKEFWESVIFSILTIVIMVFVIINSNNSFIFSIVSTILGTIQYAINFFFILLIFIGSIGFIIGFILAEKNVKLRFIASTLIFIHVVFTFLAMWAGGARIFEVLLGVEVGVGFIGYILGIILFLLTLIATLALHSFWTGENIEASPGYLSKKHNEKHG